MPDSSARSSLSEKARIDLPVRVRFRNQNSTATTTTAVTTVMPCVVLSASPSSSPVISLKSRAEMMKRSPSAKLWSSGPMMKRTRPFMMNITPIEDNHQNDRLGLLRPVEPVDHPVGGQHQPHAAQNAEGQGQQRGRQRPKLIPIDLNQPGEQDRHHRAEGHGVAMGEVGEPQDAVDQRDPERAERQLRAIGDGRDQDEIEKRHDGVEKVHQTASHFKLGEDAVPMERYGDR